MGKLKLEGVVVPTITPAAYKPSPQQVDVLRYAREESGNGLIEAVAGSGKTSTLIELCKVIRGNCAFMAYNKKIADEIGFKLTAAGINIQIIQSGTCHSFGFRAWRSVAPTVRIDADKIKKIMDGAQVPGNLKLFVGSLVSLAKNNAFGALSPLDSWLEWEGLVDHFDLTDKLYSNDESYSSEEEEDLVNQGIEKAMDILRISMDMDTTTIDFDDMIFSPLAHGVQFPKFDWVLIDEAQDTNPARRALAARMLRPGTGRLVAVGDSRQAIYGFTGASADAMEIIAEEFETTRLPLTVSYRCAKAIIKHAQKWVPHIEAAENAPDGAVRSITAEAFSKLIPEKTDAILCRNVKPLISLAFGFIRKKIPAHVEGRDIGQSMIALVKKWRTARTVADLRDKLDDYYEQEVDKLTKKGAEGKIMQLEDKIGSLKIIMAMLHDDDYVSEVTKLIESIFKDSDGRAVQSITLSTVHKAKGREWDRVYLFGRNRFMPSSFAKQEWQLEQEMNLIYVAVTRAKYELIEVIA
jgi:DNA helicase-2/ATP-dependent DNA helicase PcrA